MPGDRIKKYCLPLAEGSPPAILSGKANRRTFYQQGSKRQRLSKCPVVDTVRMLLPAPVHEQLLDLRLNMKAFWHPSDALDDKIHRCPGDLRFWFGMAVGSLENRC